MIKLGYPAAVAAVLGLMLNTSVFAQDAAAPMLPPAAAKIDPAPQAPKADVAKPAVKATVPAAKSAASETLPWATGSAAPAKPDKSGKAKSAAAETGPLKMACPGLYEAACREAQGCTWIADVSLQTGETVKAKCLDRKPQAAKEPAKKKQTATAAQPAKPATAPPKDAAVAPADVTAPAKAIVAPPAEAPAANAVVAPPASPVAPAVTAPAAPADGKSPAP